MLRDPWPSSCLQDAEFSRDSVLHILIVAQLKLSQRCKSLQSLVADLFFSFFLENLCSIARCPVVHPLVITIV